MRTTPTTISISYNFSLTWNSRWKNLSTRDVKAKDITAVSRQSICKTLRNEKDNCQDQEEKPLAENDKRNQRIRAIFYLTRLLPKPSEKPCKNTSVHASTGQTPFYLMFGSSKRAKRCATSIQIIISNGRKHYFCTNVAWGERNCQIVVYHM